MKQIHIITALCIVLVLGLASGCRKTPSYGQTSTEKMSNDWWVSMNGVVTVDNVFFVTYNTAADDGDSLWIDDLGNLTGFKCKVAIDYTSLTFSALNAPNDYYTATGNLPATVNIVGGQVLPGQGHSRSGVATDSIYFKATFSNFAATDTFVIAGTARTGFTQDEY